MKLTTGIILFFLLSVITPVRAHGDGDPDHAHRHHKNEIGLAAYPVYFVKEKHSAFGLHMHYTRNISDSGFGLGLGAEQIFGEHKHSNIGIVASYNPWEMLHLSISPGISIHNDEHTELDMSMHFEVSYGFAVKGLHIGPLLEFAIDREDYHLSLGLHFGLGF